MASITLTFSASNAARIQTALAETFELKDDDGNPREATVADYKEFMIEKTQQIVRTSEKRVAQAMIDADDDVAIS